MPIARQRTLSHGVHISANGVHIGYDLTRPAMARAGFYIGCVLLALLIWEVQQHFFAASYVEASMDKLSPLQEKQLDAYLEMNRLLTTLGTTVLGALGFLISTGRKHTLRWRELLPAMATAVAAGSSLYFGYVAYQCILWMLESSFFDLENPAIQWARHAHFYTLLLSVLFLADFVIYVLNREHNHDRVKTASTSAA